jgi:hypothetical protein
MKINTNLFGEATLLLLHFIQQLNCMLEVLELRFIQISFDNHQKIWKA